MAKAGEKDFIVQLPGDLAAVDAWEILGGGTSLPEGEYDGMIVSFTEREQKGEMVAPEVQIRYQILGGEFDGQRTMPDRFSLSEKVLGKWKQLMEAINPGKEIKGSKVSSKKARGKKLRFRVWDQENKNRPGTYMNKFTDYQPFDEDNPAEGPSAGSGSSGGGQAVSSGSDDSDADLL